MINLSVNYMGLNLCSPIIAASSGLTTQVDKVISFAKAGVGAIVVKSLFEEQISKEVDFLDKHTNSYPESADYLHFYLRQNALDKYLLLIKELKSAVDIPIIASINCYSLGEWTSFAKEIQDAGADAIELNFYSLPLNINKKSEDIEKEYLQVVGSVTKSIRIPVSVKIANTFTNLPGFVNSLKAYGAKGVVLFNRFYLPDIDIKTLKIVPSEAFSYPEEYIKELRWMAVISSLVPTIDLSASTGVHNGTAAIKQILAGASTVQLCTSLYKQGADAITESLQDISLFMDKHSYTDIKDFRGKLNYSNIEDPEKFERIQFMKTFGSKI